MRPATVFLIAPLALAVAACGERAAESPAANVAGPEVAQNAIESLPEGQRNAVFIRAIQDAGHDCQHVATSDRNGEYQGMPAWSASCTGGEDWIIVIGPGGTATVLSADAAEIAGGDPPYAENASEQNAGQ